VLLLSPVALRASQGARAVLDGTAFAGPHLLPPASPNRAAISTFHFRISLRLAAHLVTLCIVLTVALAAKSVLLTANHDMLLAERFVVPGSADVQLQRAPAELVMPASGDEVQPVVRAPQEQFVAPFADSHLLAEGETLGQVAAQYHVSVASLFWSNDLGSGNVFAAGQELRIPSVPGIPHLIEEGDTLDSIAAQYHVSPAAIILFKANGLSDDQLLPIGREIFIPNGSLPYPDDLLARFGGEQGISAMRAVSAGVVQDSDTNLRAGPGRDYPRMGTLDAGRRLKLVARHEQWVKIEDGTGQIGWVRGDLLGLSDAAIGKLAETNDFPPPPPRWVWPTRGEITSPFGWRTDPFRSFHDGLDIANAAGTKIYAARSGRVSEAGWCSGFGYCVKIDHGDGMTTIYGHMLKRPVVRAGESVTAGDLIGLMGSTYDARGGGYSTGVHLHFTVKVNGKAVNPLKFLP
jgi:murein DD-endopeptidase MepM/ murein hydrolase activator NlpD